MAEKYTGPRGGKTTVTRRNRFRKTLYFDPIDWWTIERTATRHGWNYSRFVAEAVRYWIEGNAAPLEVPLDLAAKRPLHQGLSRLHQELGELLGKSPGRAANPIGPSDTLECCWARWKLPDGGEKRLWLSDSFETLTGYSTEEFEGIGREGLVHPEDLPAALSYVYGPEGRSEHEYRILRKDGVVRQFREEMCVRSENDTVYTLGVTRDITSPGQRSRATRSSARSVGRPLRGD